MPKSILVVDDDPLLRDAYALMLTAKGYEVRTAYDGRNALVRYEESSPDLILLDMLMPNLDGVGFLKEINLADNPGATRVIVFSNLSTSDMVNQALLLGADKHITKSQMTPAQLLTEIHAILPLV